MSGSPDAPAGDRPQPPPGAPAPPAPAFYALPRGGWRDLVTLLHPPYTLLHLSFVVLGGALAPVVRLDRLGATLGAFFLAVGISAHFLDEVRGRPLGTQVPERLLVAVAVAALLLACLIGLAGTAVVSAAPLAGMVALGAFAVVAYNLELARGRFHTDAFFALFWGAFPFAVAYWVMDESIDLVAAAGAAACFAIALLQRALSTPARELRRRVASVSGAVAYRDGRSVAVTRDRLLAAPETALRCLCVAVPLLAAALLLRRLR